MSLSNFVSLAIFQIQASKNSALVCDLSVAGLVRFKKIYRFDAKRFRTTASAEYPLSSGQLHLPSQFILSDRSSDHSIAVSANGTDAVANFSTVNRSGQQKRIKTRSDELPTIFPEVHIVREQDMKVWRQPMTSEASKCLTQSASRAVAERSQAKSSHLRLLSYKDGGAYRHQFCLRDVSKS